MAPLLHEPPADPLHGIRVWLSGALPEATGTNEAERASILDFVSRFSAMVFARGGHVLHGAHPSLTPTLLARAQAHQEAGGKRDCLTIAVSRHWSKDFEPGDIAAWQKICAVCETPETLGPDARDASLETLREFMAARCDAFVAVGGRWWQPVAGRAGVPAECSAAINRGVPCFLLGGLGGAARGYVRDHPEALRRLKNGLDDAANQRMATEADVGTLAAQICEQLARLPIIRGRSADGPSFRILALDGGGIKGTFTASVLATWEDHFRSPLVDHFDLIAGTSTGGILAVGLGAGLTAAEMLAFYRERGPVIFPITSLSRRFTYGIRRIFRPKYSQEVLLRELETAYYKGNRGRIQLKDSRSRLVIPAYHAVAGISHVFRTPHHALLTSDGQGVVPSVVEI